MHWLSAAKEKFVAIAKAADSLLTGGLFQVVYLCEIVIPRDVKRADLEPPSATVGCALTSIELKLELDASVDRLRRIEDNARSTLIGATLAGALMGPTLAAFGPDGIFRGSSSEIRSSAALLLIASSIFLVVSGLLALRGYKVGHVYRPARYEFRVPRIQARIDMRTLRCIEQNDRILDQRANYLKAAFNCIRNGLILLILFQALAFSMVIDS
jgi:hypothetical protein